MQVTYVATNQFNVSGDKTGEFQPGRRIKADCGVDGIKYSTVQSSSYSSPFTTVTIAESVLTATLTDVLYGIINVGEEGSFPEHIHSSSEGQGGQIDFANLTNNAFINISDTPATYSGAEGTFLKVMSSGIVFQQADYVTEAEFSTYSGTLQSQIDSKQPAGDYVTETEFTVYSGTLQNQIDGKQPVGNYINDTEFATYSGTHTHDDRYYTESEVDALISSVSGTGGSSSGTTNYSTLGGQGIQSIRVLYKDADEITLKPGHVHINDGSSDTIYTITDELDKQVTSLSTSTWYYVYVDPPESGLTLAAADIEYSSTAPTLNETKHGYYHPTNPGQRCIGAFYSDASGNILNYHTDGRHYSIRTNNNAWQTPSTTWTAFAPSVPFGNSRVIIGVISDYVNATTWLYWRTSSSHESNLIYVTNTSDNDSLVEEIFVNSNKEFEFAYGTSTTNRVYFTTLGFYYPELIYTGPAVTQLSSSLAQTNFSAYELVAEYNLNNETLNETISNVQGDTYDSWFIEFNLENEYAGANRFGARFNNDTGDNYTNRNYGVDTDGTFEGGSTDSQYFLYLVYMSNSPAGYGAATGNSEFYLKSGHERKSITTFNQIDLSRVVSSNWTNTSSEVTSINLFTQQSATGYVRVYKFKRIYLPDTTQVPTGTQELSVEWASTSSLTIGSGKIHINDMTYTMPSSITKSVTGLSASTWYYVYVAPPTSNYILGSANIEYTSTAPSKNEAAKGYYHTTNTTWRCIGAFYSDTSSEVREFYLSGQSRWLFRNYFLTYTDETPSNTWTDQTLVVPLFEKQIVITNALLKYISSAATAYMRTNGSSGSGTYLGQVGASSVSMHISGMFDIEVDSNGIVETKWDVSTANQLFIFSCGYILPDEIYTGIARSSSAPTNVAESTFNAYEFVNEYTFNNETIDIIINNVDGDVNDVWKIEYELYSGGSTGSLHYRFNSDSGNNYYTGYIGESNDGGQFSHSESASTYGNLATCYDVSLVCRGSADLRLNSGRPRTLDSVMTIASTTDAAWHHLNYFSWWNNTVNEVNTIALYSTINMTGTIRVYKFKRVYLPTSIEGANTFLGMTDTPSTYSGTSGYYAQSTGSGIQWAEVQAAGDYLTESEFSTYSGTLQDQLDNHYHDDRYYTESEIDALFTAISGSVESGFEAYELVAEYNLSDETLSETLTGLTGDTDKLWKIEFHFANTDTSNAHLLIRPNGDDTVANYYFIYNGTSGGAANIGATATPAYAAFWVATAPVGDSVSGSANLYLKSGIYRKSVSVYARNEMDERATTRWDNTADEVTSPCGFIQTTTLPDTSVFIN
jgi:hypothetical protein